MPTYEKINSTTFKEITTSERIITRDEIIAQRDRLKAAYESLTEPTPAEKIQFADAKHPYYFQRQRLIDQWQELKNLIEYLQSL